MERAEAAELAAPLPEAVIEPTQAESIPDQGRGGASAGLPLIVPGTMTAASVDSNSEARRRHLPVCPFCSSSDTMEPFRRSSHVFLASTIFRRLRWRYCRSCTRHFMALLPRSRRA